MLSTTRWYGLMYSVSFHVKKDDHLVGITAVEAQQWSAGVRDSVCIFFLLGSGGDLSFAIPSALGWALNATMTPFWRRGHAAFTSGANYPGGVVAYPPSLCLLAPNHKVQGRSDHSRLHSSSFHIMLYSCHSLLPQFFSWFSFSQLMRKRLRF